MAEVRFIALVCEQTQDQFGPDQAFMAFFVDGEYIGSIFRQLLTGQTVNLGVNLEFNNEIRIQLWEIDNPSLGNPHDFLGEVQISGGNLTGNFTFDRAGGRYRLNWVDVQVPVPGPAVGQQLVARKNQENMTTDERNLFINAVNQLITNSTYGQLVVDHAGPLLNFRYRNHFFATPGSDVAEQRFLPWHRVYLRRLEEALIAIDSRLFVPYWRWTVNRGIPAWLQGFTPSVRLPAPLPGLPNPLPVTRSPSLFPLPTINQVQQELANPTYASFTRALERGSHGDVHVWVGNTMSDPRIASADILFWLHHCEIDRLWRVWQGTHSEGPALTGVERTMDPWNDTVDNLLDIEAYGYTYV